MTLDVHRARAQLTKAQAWHKSANDKKHRPLFLKKGDWVYLSTEPIKLAAAVCRRLKQMWI